MGLSKRQIFFHLKFYVFILTDVYPVWLRNKYKINITNLNSKYIDTNKSISFEVTDENLLELSGGIVQGMSRSPIIQNNKLIGAVTHVVIDEVNKGYAVFIRTMLEEGDE